MADRIFTDAKSRPARPKVGEMRHQATASSSSDALPCQEGAPKSAVWGSSIADCFQTTRGDSFRWVHPREIKPVGDSISSSSFTPAPRHIGDPLLLSSFIADDPISIRATKEFENSVSAAPLLEGVDHLVLPQKFDEADHETTEEENEMPGQKRPLYGSGW